jgi:hypothetical protein
MSHPFEARYSGYCKAQCGDPIEVGDLVAFTDDGLMHNECSDSPAPVERPVTVCQSCWLVQPCDCEDQR